MFTVLLHPQNFTIDLLIFPPYLQNLKKGVNTIFINMEDLYNEKTFINSFLALSSHKKHSIISRVCYSDNNLKMLGNQYPLNIAEQSVIKTNLL